ncbi:MAG: ABC transporter ATP-binding protein [Longimonas sp.]|uniref:ABC transporter ATP-binding protein n=1 Tax=Longimonas sp. TaxID=2039626 RepID=UPI00335B29F0
MITLRNISKEFGSEQVLHDVHLTLNKGDTLAVLGASGSGKTTLLKIIAGIHREHSGSIHVGDTRIDPLPPQKRGVVYLYQEALLFPHLTVRENVGFGLSVQNAPANTQREAVDAMIRDMGLAAHADKYPAQLSGGQRQRVAFGRAAIIHPDVLLLDEPFASLDFDTRNEMQQLFTRISDAHTMTTLFVTHDAREALRVGDRFAQMRDGMLHTYDSRRAFIEDAASGVQSELDFWTKIQQEIAADSSPQ